MPLAMANWRNVTATPLGIRDRAICVRPNASGKSKLLDVSRFFAQTGASAGRWQSGRQNRTQVMSIRSEISRFLLATACSTWLILFPQLAKSETLAADLYMLITCDESLKTHLSKIFETHLRSLDFNVHNGFFSEWDHFRISGWRRDAIVDLTQSPTMSDRYSLALITEPPTRRHFVLEQNLIQLFDDIENCKITFQIRHENDETKLDVFRRFLRIRASR